MTTLSQHSITWQLLAQDIFNTVNYTQTMLPLNVIGWTHAVFHFQVVSIYCVLGVNMFTFLSDVMVVCSIITN